MSALTDERIPLRYAALAASAAALRLGRFAATLSWDGEWRWRCRDAAGERSGRVGDLPFDAHLVDLLDQVCVKDLPADVADPALWRPFGYTLPGGWSCEVDPR